MAYSFAGSWIIAGMETCERDGLFGTELIVVPNEEFVGNSYVKVALDPDGGEDKQHGNSTISRRV
jgi:hypothetical protein